MHDMKDIENKNEKSPDASSCHATRLLDILTEEVSLVPMAANKKRWLVRKGIKNMAQEIEENGDGTMSSVGDDEKQAQSDEKSNQKQNIETNQVAKESNTEAKEEVSSGSSCDEESTGNTSIQATKGSSEALAILEGALLKVAPGKALDEDSFQKLQKLRSMLSGNNEAPRSDVENQAETQKAETEEVKKAGAIMSSDRRKRFGEAIKSLMKLFEEVIPSSEIGKMPRLVTKSADQIELDDLRCRLEKANNDLCIARAEISSLLARPAESNVSNTDGGIIGSGKNDVLWPSDLNAE